MPKKNLRFGYSAMKTSRTAIWTGRTPACVRSSSGADDARQDDDGGEEDPELGAPHLRLEATAEVPQQGDRDGHPEQAVVESVGERPRRDAPDLAVEDLVGNQRELGEERLVDRLDAVDQQRDGARGGENGGGTELDLADAEPRIVGAAPVWFGEREAVGHVATVPAAAPVV